MSNEDDITNELRRRNELEEKRLAEQRHARDLQQRQHSDNERRDLVLHSEQMEQRERIHQEQQESARETDRLAREAIRVQRMQVEQQEMLYIQQVQAEAQRAKMAKLNTDLNRAADAAVRTILICRDQLIAIDRDGVPEDPGQAVNMLYGWLVKLNIADEVLQRSDDRTPAQGEFSREAPSTMCARIAREYMALYLRAVNLKITAFVDDVSAEAQLLLAEVPESGETIQSVTNRYELAVKARFYPKHDYFDDGAYRTSLEEISKMLMKSLVGGQRDLAFALSEIGKIPERNLKERWLVERYAGDVLNVFRCRLYGTLKWPAPIVDGPGIYKYTSLIKEPLEITKKSGSAASFRFISILIFAIGIGVLTSSLMPQLTKKWESTGTVVWTGIGAGVATLLLMLFISMMEKDNAAKTQEAKIRRTEKNAKDALSSELEAQREKNKLWWAGSASQREALLNSYATAFPSLADELREIAASLTEESMPCRSSLKKELVDGDKFIEIETNFQRGIDRAYMVLGYAGFEEATPNFSTEASAATLLPESLIPFRPKSVELNVWTVPCSGMFNIFMAVLGLAAVSFGWHHILVNIREHRAAVQAEEDARAQHEMNVTAEDRALFAKFKSFEGIVHPTFKVTQMLGLVEFHPIDPKSKDATPSGFTANYQLIGRDRNQMEAIFNLGKGQSPVKLYGLIREEKGQSALVFWDTESVVPGLTPESQTGVEFHLRRSNGNTYKGIGYQRGHETGTIEFTLSDKTE